MPSKKTFWITTLAFVTLGLLAGVTVADLMIHQSVESAEAMWKQNFDTPRALARSVDAVVLAQALDSRPGRVATSDKGEGPLPFQLVDFEVVHGLRGADVGERITVERAGGVDPTGSRVAISADGGEFAHGEVYLLFLKKQDGTPFYYQVNHQGRYHLNGDHFLAAFPDDRVATQLHGVTLEQGLARVEASLGARRPASPAKK